MQLDQIEAYRAVVTKGSMQAAAKELGISQSAVSRRISQLEASLGFALFIRHKTSLLPTRESHFLRDQLLVLSDRSSRLKRLANEVRSGNSPIVNLRIAVPSSLTISVIPGIIAEFLKVNEKVRIELHSGPYDTIERMLLDDRAEIGFLRLPMQRKGLEARPLLQVRTVCVLPKNHPLAAQKSISIDDLHSVPLILLGRQRTPRSELDVAFLNAKFTPNVKVETHSVCSACGMAASGIGVALVNELMARDYSHLEIVVRPLKEVLLHRFAFAISAELPPTQAAEDFMELCATRLDELLTHALP